MSNQINAVEAQSRVLAKAALVVGTLVLTAAFVVGLTTLLQPVRPTPELPQAVLGLDAGAFAPLASPTPLPREVEIKATDAGTKATKFDPSERREEFKARMDLLAMDVGIKYGDNVSVQKIYFAVTSTEKADAAIVLLRAEKMKEVTGLIFLFNGDTWKAFPSDFQ